MDADILTREEELHPDLARYVERVGSMTVLRHPLVFQVPYDAHLNALCNATYEARKRVRQKEINDKNWRSFIFIHERPHRFNALSYVQTTIRQECTAAEWWQLVRDVWQDSENIWQNLQSWKRIWRSRFYPRFACDRHLVMDEDERAKLASMAPTFSIYRGIAQRASANGLSWTLDRDKAAWFAKRYNTQLGYVCEAEAQKNDVLAYLDGRNEQEIVVIRKRVIGITKQ